MSASQSLEGKVAVVTGGSRGLGREIAHTLAADGAHVVIASRKFENCVEVARQLESEFGVRALPYRLHMGEWDEQVKFVNAVEAEFGRLDVLVNNAGMSPRYDSLQSLSESLFDKVIDVNLKGAFKLSVDAFDLMARTGGSIINISSIAAERPTVGELPYAIAKSGINLMTRVLADDFGPAVRVNTIMCGAFETDVAAAWDPEVVAKKMKQLPLQRVGQPDEVVGAVRYFAGADSSYTTGAVLTVDGGRLAVSR